MMPIVAANLSSARAAHKLTLAELSARCGIRVQELWRFEHGERLPKLPALIALADALDLSLDELVGRDRNAKRRKRA